MGCFAVGHRGQGANEPSGVIFQIRPGQTRAASSLAPLIFSSAGTTLSVNSPDSLIMVVGVLVGRTPHPTRSAMSGNPGLSAHVTALVSHCSSSMKPTSRIIYTKLDLVNSGPIVFDHWQLPPDRPDGDGSCRATLQFFAASLP
jgi:hypothetical protein